MLAKCDDVLMGREEYLRRREQDRLQNIHLARDSRICRSRSLISTCSCHLSFYLLQTTQIQFMSYTVHMYSVASGLPSDAGNMCPV